jgi:ADP-ribose pyrophosphatase YjhB (NUDIX family)
MKILDSISIDTVVFGFTETLEALLIKQKEGPHKGSWALPGGFIYHSEDIDQAAKRLLEDLTGVKDIYLEQIKAFGETDRYPLRRVVTIGYYSLIQPNAYPLTPGSNTLDIRWFKVTNIKELPFDHLEILKAGHKALAHSLLRKPIGFDLLPEHFTLYQLQQLYESILDKNFEKSNFRRAVLKTKILEETGLKQQGQKNRAPKLYRFNQEKYNSLIESDTGINLDFK